MTRLVIRPKRKSRYYVVLKVFRTKVELNKKRRWLQDDAKKCDACAVFGLGDKWKLGEVWFYRKSVTPDLLAHEFIHIGLEYLRRLDRSDLREKVNYELPYNERPEEILCYAVQELLGQAMYGLEL